jgi:hypothetical protein
VCKLAGGQVCLQAKTLVAYVTRPSMVNKKTKCVGPCASRYHLGCLQINETEYNCYMAMGDSTFKCDPCIKSLRSQRRDDTHVKTRSASSTDTPVEGASPTKCATSDTPVKLRSSSTSDLPKKNNFSGEDLSFATCF